MLVAVGITRVDIFTCFCVPVILRGTSQKAGKPVDCRDSLVGQILDEGCIEEIWCWKHLLLEPESRHKFDSYARKHHYDARDVLPWDTTHTSEFLDVWHQISVQPVIGPLFRVNAFFF